MKKLSNTEAELKKSVASKKALKYNILKDNYQKNKDVVIAYVRYFLYFYIKKFLKSYGTFFYPT